MGKLDAVGLESSAREEADPKATPLQMQRAFVAEAFLQQVGWLGSSTAAKLVHVLSVSNAVAFGHNYRGTATKEPWSVCSASAIGFG